MKQLIAEKVKDGWYVRIIETLHLYSENEVSKLAKQNGLKVNRELLALQGEKIIAE